MNVTNSLLQRRTALLEKARQILDNNTTLTVEQKTEIMGLRKAASELANAADDQWARQAEVGTLDVDPSTLIPITDENGFGFRRNRMEAAGAKAKAPTIWRAADGAEIRVLDPHHRVSDLVSPEVRDRQQGLNLGKFLRGALTGRWEHAEAERRAMQGQLNTAGGILVPEILAANFIDLARDRSVAFRLGAKTIPMQSDSVIIARAAADPTYSMTQENVAITESTPSFDGINLVAKKLASLVVVSSEIIEDAPNASQVLESMLVNAFAAELDRQILWGSGSEELLGIYGTPGILSQTSTGTPASWAKWVAAWAALLAEGCTPNGFILAPRDAGTLESLLAAVGGMYLTPPASIAALQREIAPSTPLTGLPGSNESASLMGDWSTLIVGVRRDLRIEISRDRYFAEDSIGVKTTWRGDSALEHPTWMCRITGITAT